MVDDAELLTRYFREGEEEAFEELVSRRFALVYSAAVRQVGRRDLAEEVTQAVFVLLAKKAKRLVGHPFLVGWLHKTTRLTALKLMERESQRRRRERERLQRMPEAEDSGANWQRIAPHLDAAMARLSEGDRTVLILRFFEHKSLREIGSVLGATEDATQKRLSRALERLRRLLARKAPWVSATMLGECLASKGMVTASSGLNGFVASAALAKGAGLSTSTLTLIQETAGIMTWLNLKTAIPVATVVLAAAGTPIAIQQSRINELETETRQLRQESVAAAKLREQVTKLQSRLAKLREEGQATKEELVALRGRLTELRQENRRYKKALSRLDAENKAIQGRIAALGDREREEGNPSKQEEKEKTVERNKLNAIKRLALSYILYLEDYGKAPPDLKALVNHIEDEADRKKVLDGVELDNIEMAHYASQDEMEQEHSTILLRTSQPFKGPNGNQLWAYGFGDGHAEISNTEMEIEQPENPVIIKRKK